MFNLPDKCIKILTFFFQKKGSFGLSKIGWFFKKWDIEWEQNKNGTQNESTV